MLLSQALRAGRAEFVEQPVGDTVAKGFPEDERSGAKTKIPHCQRGLQVLDNLERSEAGAAELLKKFGTKAEAARDLPYRLLTIYERRKWSKDAMAYDTLVLSWPNLVRLTQERPATSTKPTQEKLL